ncbi:unnamed protein product [Cunninghamella blakesleeana]
MGRTKDINDENDQSQRNKAICPSTKITSFFNSACQKKQRLQQQQPQQLPQQLPQQQKKNTKCHTHHRSLSLTEHSFRISPEKIVPSLNADNIFPRAKSTSPNTLIPSTTSSINSLQKTIGTASYSSTSTSISTISTTTTTTTTTASSIKKPSAFANILCKAKRQQPKRSLTIPSISSLQFDDISITDTDTSFQLLDDDECEADKSQLKNEFMNLAFTNEFKSTINLSKLPEGKILDIGKGSFDRCIGRSKMYPQLQVISIDPGELFQDNINMIPTNCHFINNKNVLDTLEHDEFEAGSFDFIHIRFMAMELSERQYNKLIQLCWRLLKPNCNLELLELDMQICSVGTITNKWIEELLEVGNYHGFKLDLAKILADYIPKDDCINLQQKYQSLPMGLWGGRLGVLCRDDILDTYRRSQTALCKFYSRPPADKHDTNSDISIMSREMEQHHSFANFHFISVNKRPSYK